VTKRIHDSSAALVVISPDFLSLPACLFQFRQAYSHMVARRHGPLLLLLLRPVPRRAPAAEPRLRAMLTLGMVFKVSEEKELLKAVKVTEQAKRRMRGGLHKREKVVTCANVEDGFVDIANIEA
jgi:hypothetical protein